MYSVTGMGKFSKVEEYLRKYYFYLLQIGLISVSWEKKWAIISALQYFIYFSILLLFTFDFFYTAYLCMGDITLFSQSLHFGIVCVVASTVSINCTIFRQELLGVFSCIIDGLCNYEKGEFYEGEMRQLQKKKKILLIFWPLYYGFCCLIGFVLGPMLDNYLGIDVGETPHPQVSLKLPVSFWIPFDIEANIIIYIGMCILVGIMGFIDAIISHSRLYKEFGKVVEVPLAVPFLAGALLLAMAGIHILSDDPRIGPKLLSGSLVFGEMLNILMLCVCGENLKKLNEDLKAMIYSIKWYERGKQCCSSVSIIQKRTNLPMNIKCFYILEINMQTFATIINSAYSYFNLVFAFK